MRRLLAAALLAAASPALAEQPGSAPPSRTRELLDIQLAPRPHVTKPMAPGEADVVWRNYLGRGSGASRPAAVAPAAGAASAAAASPVGTSP